METEAMRKQRRDDVRHVFGRSSVVDATTPAVVSDAQQYGHDEAMADIFDLARLSLGGMTQRVTSLVAYIERLEAERDALRAEHEAITMMLPLCGLDWKEEGCDDPCDVCSLPPVHAAHDNAERVIRGE